MSDTPPAERATAGRLTGVGMTGTDPSDSSGPLEVQLVLAVKGGRTCTFFWPGASGAPPYGPYATYDFLDDIPVGAAPGQAPFAWLEGVTRPPSVPDPEILGGCRKAPILTLGINPNLTAFFPGPAGEAAVYPNFTSDDTTETNGWANYAYYHRYRSLYQEQLAPGFVQQYLDPVGQVTASRAGVLKEDERESDLPSLTLKVLYDGDSIETPIALPGAAGEAPWAVLAEPGESFAAGDVLAARLSVPAGVTTEIYRTTVGYYERFVQVLSGFDAYLRTQGYEGRPLAMGEDVAQLDMVACASPHWGNAYLGGTDAARDTVISNCVTSNAWAIKQLVQTAPAVLYLVGEASYDMFCQAAGALLDRATPLPATPEDGAFTLLRATSDPGNPCYLKFTTSIDGHDYSLKARIVVSPHFSFPANFVPQIRLSPAQWSALQADDPGCASFLENDHRIARDDQSAIDPGAFVAFTIGPTDVVAVLAEVGAKFADVAEVLQAAFYDPNALLGQVLTQAFESGELPYGPADPAAPAAPADTQVLTRTSGPCSFCVNASWRFPLGCPYGKPDEALVPAGVLESVATLLIEAGTPKVVAPVPAAELPQG